LTARTTRVNRSVFPITLEIADFGNRFAIRGINDASIAAASVGRPTRERILTAARTLFHREGIRATGVDRNAELAYVSKRTLYQHNPTIANNSRETTPTNSSQLTRPNAPVNHFHVIQPQNEIPGHAYAAYWFGPGESLYPEGLPLAQLQGARTIPAHRTLGASKI